MKAFTSICIFILLAFTTSGQVIYRQYYYLQIPVSDIFSNSYSIPNGKYDPRPASSNSGISKEDLEYRKGPKKQDFKQIKDRDNAYLFQTWSHHKNIEISGSFRNVVHVRLKDAAWGKIHDNLYHPVEALKADTAIFTIKTKTSDTAGTAIIQRIALLFVNSGTVLGSVLNILGDSSSNTSSNSVYKVGAESGDSISFMIVDTSVFYAVRYISIGEAKDNFVINGKIEAPICKTMLDYPAPEFKEVSMKNRAIFPLLRENCEIGNEKLKVYFLIDRKNSDYSVVIIRNKKQQVSTPATSPINETADTIATFKHIDFDTADEYFDESHRYVSNVKARKTGVRNIIVNIFLKFKYDKELDQLKIVNFQNGQYQTCIAYQYADVQYFPN